MKFRYFYILICFTAFCLASCEKDFFPDADPSHSRLFRPTGFAAASVNGTPVTEFTFNSIPGAASYTFQISRDSVNFDGSIVTERSIQPVADATFKVTYSDLKGATKYYARIRTNSADATGPVSEWSFVSFTTPTENLFKDFTANIGVVSKSAVQLQWTAASNVTSVEFVPNSGTTIKETITDAEKAAGKKVVSNLQNNTYYTVNIYRNEDNRGSIRLKVEGDYFLANGESLTATLNQMNNGEVVVLAAGGVFTDVTAYAFKAGMSVTIKGAPGSKKPIISYGEPSGTPNSFSLPSAGGAKIRFENVDICGYVNGDPTAFKRAYLFNQSVTGYADKLAFENCIIRNFSTTSMRFRQGTTVDSLIVNNCVITDAANNYYFVHVENTGAAKNVVISNSTMYGQNGSVMRHNSSTPAQSLLVQNCTFNNLASDYFIRMDSSPIQAVTIENSILGKTTKAISGINVLTGSTLTVNNSFRTSDFDDSANAARVISSLSSYTKAASALFTDPDNGVFKFKDSGFGGKSTAGDPRWR